MLALVVTCAFSFAVAAAEPATPPPLRRSVRRITVPVADKSGVTFDAFSGRLVIRGAGPSGRGTNDLLPEGCAAVPGSDRDVVALCPDRRIELRVRSDGGTVVDITSLRGLPSFPRDPLRRIAYFRRPPGTPCVSERIVEQAECAFEAERFEDARRLFLEAQPTAPDPAHVSLRLGDIAAERGALAEAADWYRRTGGLGPFGRLARVRLCELEGRCLQDEPLLGPGQVYDATALDPPFAVEMLLRAARAALVLGRTQDAASILQRQLTDDPREPMSGACRQASELCRDMVLGMLDTAPLGVVPDLLPLFFQIDMAALPREERVVLARQVARRGAELGGASFAAAWLSFISDDVPVAERTAHLELITRQYVEARELARAGVVADFAVSMAKTEQAKRQAAGLRALVDNAIAAEQGTGEPPKDPEMELARTLLKKAKEVMAASANR